MYQPPRDVARNREKRSSRNRRDSGRPSDGCNEGKEKRSTRFYTGRRRLICNNEGKKEGGEKANIMCPRWPWNPGGTVHLLQRFPPSSRRSCPARGKGKGERWFTRKSEERKSPKTTPLERERKKTSPPSKPINEKFSPGPGWLLFFLLLTHRKEEKESLIAPARRVP